MQEMSVTEGWGGSLFERCLLAVRDVTAECVLQCKFTVLFVFAVLQRTKTQESRRGETERRGGRRRNGNETTGSETNRGGRMRGKEGKDRK